MSVTNDEPKPEEISVDLSSDRLAIAAKGGGASRLTHALADVLSPLSNGLGWVGDQLSIRRQAAALRTAQKARKMLANEGIDSADIPPKILLPWMEGASLEDESSGNDLSDAWAGLLARAAKSSDAAVISYIETLKRLGKEEAELLEFFATDTAPFYAQKFYEARSVGIFSARNPLLPNVVASLEVEMQSGDLERLREFMDSFGFQGMVQVIFFSTRDHKMVPTPYFEKFEHAVSNLEHLGLINRTYGSIETSGFGKVDLIWFGITKYAFDLFWACQGTVTSVSRFPSVVSNVKPDK